MPKTSVLIPTYNGAAHIAPAIESVLAQDVDLELIVTDDASRDATIAIVESYRDPRIRIEHNPCNLGPEGNWNRALGLATGTYVKLLPQDDIIQPGALAKQIAVLENDRDERIALVFGARTILDTNGKILITRGYGRTSGLVSAAELARASVIKGTNPIGEPGAVLFRKSLADRVGLFDASQGYVVDLDYWLRLLAHGGAWYLADPVSAFRVSGGSWSVRIGTAQAREYWIFLDRMAAAGLVPSGKFDMAIGKAMALANNIARLIFYKFVVG